MITTNYPLYSVVSLGNGHIAIAGGGGASKTGVPNALEVHRLYSQGGELQSQQLGAVDTGSSAVMNCCSLHGGRAIACGMDESCALIAVAPAAATASPGATVRDRRGRRGASKHSDGAVSLSIDAKKQTDFHVRYALQKVVRFGPKQETLATGGADGRIRLWQYPSLNQIQVMDEMHTDDVDDLAFHPSQPLIISVSCDKKCYVWKIGQGKHVAELKFTKSPAGQPYKFRSCRFLPSLPALSSSSSTSDATLVTSHSPVSLHRPPASYVCLWRASGEASGWKEDKWVSVGNDPVSCLSCLTNRTGRFIGIGTLMGSVRVLNDNLQTLCSVRNVHSMYITSVALTTVPSDKDTDLPVLVSVSDRTCKVTQIKSGYRDVLLLFFIVIFIALAFAFFTRTAV